MMKLKLFTLSFLIGYSLCAQTLQVQNLQCEYRTNPLAVDTRQPRLSWQITSTGNNILQSSYRIIVADNPTDIKVNRGNVWDSKKINSNQSIQVSYRGPMLQAAKTYYWKVMVWDNKKNTSSWSNQAYWQMGLLAAADWKNAVWIAYEKMNDSLRLPAITSESKRALRKDVLPLLRKEFSLKKSVKKATIFMTGLGHFELSLNGQKTGDHFLDAGWTDYDKHALYVAFDITGQLKKGANALGVALGNGFYFVPGERYIKVQTVYGYPKVICRLLLEYADGSSEDIVSNQTWKTTAGPTTFSSIYGGEDYDATLAQNGWDAPAFDDRQWKPAMIVDGPGELDAQTAEPLKIMDSFTVKKITQLRPGVYVYDFGQNASGIPQITLKGNRGDVVRLRPAELLDSGGQVTTKPVGEPVYFDYTLKGDGIETWQPKFMYYGFRYVQVEGAVPANENKSDTLPAIVLIRSLHTRNAATRVGEFSCSNELFNKTDALIEWAIRSNMSSLLTDCPHREKLGWMEEAHLMGPSIRYNYDIASLCIKVVRDMMHAQTESGLVPDIAPEYAVFGNGFRDSPEWGSNSIIMPWYIYEWYGDEQLLQEAYPMMQRYIDYLKSKSKDGILSHGLGDWYDIGPGAPGPSQLTPKGITATAIFYYDLQIMSKIATILHKEKDAGRYNELAVKVKSAYNTMFFNEATRQYGSGSQTSNAMSVYMNLVPPRYKDDVINNIVKELRDHNNSLTAGDIGYRYLLRVLDDNNRSDVIYDMNSNAAVPGYGYQLDRGATALTESWQAFPTASNNHMMLGHIKEWFFSRLAGIRPAKNSVAFNKIEIRPQPVGDVTYAKAGYQSPYGLISSEWRKTGTAFELTTEIPPNTTALIFLPATKGAPVTESRKAILSNKIQYKNGYALILVGSGKYYFKV